MFGLGLLCLLTRAACVWSWSPTSLYRMSAKINLYWRVLADKKLIIAEQKMQKIDY